VNLLAIDTATELVSVAIHDGDRIVASAEAIGERRHTELLAPMIDGVCRQAGIGLRDIAELAVDVGPGMFTGMRVGVATAKALAEVLDVLIHPVASTEIVAVGRPSDTPVVAAVLDARRGQVFWSLHAGGGCVLDPRVGSIEECAADVVDRGQPVTLIGTGALRYEAEIRELLRLSGVVATFADAASARPTAAVLAGMVRGPGTPRTALPTDEVSPLYLRAPDAEINWVTRS